MNTLTLHLRRYFFWYIIVGYFGIIFLLFGRVLPTQFLSDDFHLVSIVHTRTKPLLHFFTTNYAGGYTGFSYRPLMNLFMGIAHGLSGLHPFAYHLVNLLFHAGNSVLVCAMVYLLCHKRLVAFFSGFLFALMPNHLEVVVWIAGMADALTTFFFLCAVLLYILWEQTKRRPYYVFSLFAFVCALFAKEMAISLPLVLFMIHFIFFDHTRDRSSILKGVFSVAPFCLLVALYLFIRYKTTGIFVGYYGEPNLILRVYRMIETISSLVSDLFVTGNLRRIITQFLVRYWYIAYLAVLLGIYIGYRRIRFSRMLCLYALLWFGITIAPVLPLSVSMVTDEGERFNYLPSVAFAFFVPLILLSIEKQKKVGMGLLIFLSLFWGWMSWHRSSSWVEASTIVDRVVRDFERFIPVDGSASVPTYVFIGLPDHLDDAHVFRNGIAEALSFFYGSERIGTIIRIPVFTLLSSVVSNPEIEWTFSQNAFFGTVETKTPIITGKDREEYEGFIYELWGYDYATYRSSEVKFILTPSRLQEIKEGKLVLLTWDGRRLLHLLPLY